MTLLDQIRQFPPFETVPDEQLQWLIDRGEERTFAQHDAINKPGEPVDNLMLVLDGHISIGNSGDEIATYPPQSILGVLPFSRLTKAVSRVVADEPTRVLLLHRDHFRTLAHECYDLTETLVHQMTTRVRDFTRQAQQNEKLASLGRLSAGLAHELNNPVAAVVRSADTLKEHLRATPDAFKTLMHLSLTDQQVDAVNEVIFRRIDQQAQRLSLMERSSLEDEVTDWLDDHGVDDALDLAGPLVDFGFTTEDLDWTLDQIGHENLPGVMGWVVDNLVTEKLVLDISEASKRISTLVGSIKNYTQMDRGMGKTEVNLAEGIRNTLILLDHKLKGKKISVSLNLPDTVPSICGWPGELNQVWTNLIDNSIDALPDGGQLTISTQPDGDFVLTKVIDNGMGIPEAIQNNIFDPFFTTKEIGKGTGLGLDIVQGIVKHHNGSVKVKSIPGQTEFSVCLPIQ